MHEWVTIRKFSGKDPAFYELLLLQHLINNQGTIPE
jgi:hypothetical protein